MRFVAVQEPPHSWAVFDAASDEPAEYAGRLLIGLTSCEAEWFAAAANDHACSERTPAVSSSARKSIIEQTVEKASCQTDSEQVPSRQTVR
jgi:hypothetical protein